MCLYMLKSYYSAFKEFAAFAPTPTPLAGPGVAALLPLATVGITAGLYCGTPLEAALLGVATGLAGS